MSFTPESAKPHYIDIKFNGEAVPGCPFVCNVSDTSRVILSLSHLELIPVDQPANFHMAVDGSGSAELAVSVRGNYLFFYAYNYYKNKFSRDLKIF